MALANYTDLVAAVARWTDRDDLAGDVPTYLALFEATFNSRYQLQAMLGKGALVYAGDSYPLPADFAAMRSVYYAGSPNIPLDPMPPGYTDAVYPQSGASPQFYDVRGGNIYLTPDSNLGLTLRYYQKLPALSAAATTNWLMTRFPNAYLFGTLVEAYMMNQEEDRAGFWRARYNEVDELLVRNDGSTRFPSARMRAHGLTP